MIKLFETFISGTPEIVWRNITKIRVNYVDFNGKIQSGIVECNKKVAKELESIFKELFRIKFPIKEINPISYYNNDDMQSVKANNTSCFNYRFVIGSNKLSDHSTGNAIDINPMQNPWVHPSAHKIEGREYKPGKKGTITEEVVEIFKMFGWSWGGEWKNPDYQHFFKPDNDFKNKILRSLNESIDEIDPYGEEDWEDPITKIKVGDKIFNNRDPSNFAIITKIDEDVIHLMNPNSLKRSSKHNWTVEIHKFFQWLDTGVCGIEKVGNIINNENMNIDIDPYGEEIWDDIEIKAGDKARIAFANIIFDNNHRDRSVTLNRRDILIFKNKSPEHLIDLGEYVFNCDRFPGYDLHLNRNEFEPIINESFNELDPYGEEIWDYASPIGVFWELIEPRKEFLNKKYEREIIQFSLDYPNRGILNFSIEQEGDDPPALWYRTGYHSQFLKNNTFEELWDAISFLIEGV